MLTAATMLTGCYSLGASGPNTHAIMKVQQKPADFPTADIKIINLTDSVARRIVASSGSATFASALGDDPTFSSIVNQGDLLDISIWEAPPAALFGTAAQTTLSAGDSKLPSALPVAQTTALPEQMVDENGRIQVPFAGSIPAAGHTPNQIEAEIVSRLRGKAHNPQVIVRLARSATKDVTVVGDVTQNARVPLSPKGERLLDVLATAGGVKQPVNKTTIQITRGSTVISMPLEKVIRDPAQNIRLRANDVVTALYQPYSFTALGAVGRNAEINFEGTGLTLSQALGRMDGLRDDRADIKGVFIFRLEDPANLDPSLVAGATTTPDGKIPVIYRADLKDPTFFFTAQGFPIRNRDVLYVSNAPLVDLMKFVNIVSSLAYTATAVNTGIH